MIENILIFVRNCVMAVLTAWAGIQIAEKAQPGAVEATPVVAATSGAAIRALDNGDNCPDRLGPGDETPASAASSDPDRSTPSSQPSVMTIR